MPKPFEVGNKVKYKREWLRSTGQMTGDVPHARGEIKELKSLSAQTTLATVEWNNGLGTMKVNTQNLAHASDPERV